MAQLLLIHGAAHGAWCWREVIPALADLGHSATAIDLPSHGADETPLAEVTLDLYAQAIIDALPTPAIVVGHSLGGYPITLAAERAPHLVQRLVYLCAYTPWPGLTLSDMRLKAPSQPLAPARRPVEAGFTFDPAMAPDLFYHDCSADQIAFALYHLCPQASAPSQTVIELTEASQSLPRSYITCTQDRAIPPEFQTTMAERLPAADRHSMNASHSPFFSAPGDLARLLDRIARTDARNTL